MNQIAARGRPFYERFGWAYDLLVADSVEPWVDAVCTALGSLEIIAPAEILDAGCGTGRHAEELTARGHSVTLVDASEALLAQARRRVPTAAAVRTDLRKLDLHASFDAIACRGVLNDLVDDEDRDAVLGAFARHLRSSGVLVLDVRELSGTAQRYGTGHQAEKVIDTARGPLTYSSLVSFDGKILRVNERHELHRHTGDVVAEHVLFMRPWTAAELRDRLTRAGFTRVSLTPGAGRVTNDRLLCTATPIRS